MDRYIVIGGSKLQLDFIRCVKAYGFEVHVIDYNPSSPGASEADVFHCVSIDNKEEILQIAKKISAVGIHTVSTEQGNVSACYVGEILGLATNSYETALNTTNKIRMKKILIQHQLHTPSATAFTNITEIADQNFEFPLMVKASDRSAGRGIQLVRSKQGLQKAAEEAFEQSLEGRILIEEFFEAPQYSVETISYRGKHQIIAITEQWMDGSVNCVETGHYLPANISTENEKLISQFCLKVMDAFEIQYGACHIEIRIKNGQVTLIEIASRMGGWRHWMIDYALNTNYLLSILKSSLDLSPFTSISRSNMVSMCRIITSPRDLKLYQLFRKRHPEKFIADLVDEKDKVFTATSLIDASGLYIYKSNEQFEKKYWTKIEHETR